MLYHIVLTDRCNLRCRYCGGAPGARGMPPDITYPLDELRSFLSRDPEADVNLYGGEPLLRSDLVEAICRWPLRRVHLQTNGLLLERLSDWTLRRLDSILVSVDGRPEITDDYRGLGTYKRATAAAAHAQERGARNLVARMVVSSASDVYEEVTHLARLNRPRFDHIHWQIDAVWSADGTWEDFPRWARESYIPGIDRLIEEWTDEMRSGRVPGLVPFLGIMDTLLTGYAPGLRCGAGRDAFAVATDGTIMACPISPEMEWNRLGHIRDTDPLTLRGSVPVLGCDGCEAVGACGGRCLYFNREGGWSEAWMRAVCDTVRHTVRALRARVPEIRRLIANGTLPRDAFAYTRVNDGCEVIP